MYDKRKMKELLHDIGQEVAIQELEENQESQEEFPGYQRIRDLVLEQVEKEDQKKHAGRRKKKVITRKKWIALAAALAAVLGLSITVYAAVQHFVFDEKIVGNGEYELNVNLEDGDTKPTALPPVQIITEYLPEGYVSNQASYDEKYCIYKEGTQAYTTDSLTIGAEPISTGKVQMGNVTASEDTTIGRYAAKVLTTFLRDGSTGHTIILLDEEAGYWFFIYGNHSGLPLEELEKIGEHLSYQTVEGVPKISVVKEEKDSEIVEAPGPLFAEEHIFQVGETRMDRVASNEKAMASLTEENKADEDWQNRIASSKVEYTVNEITVSDFLPDIDLETGNSLQDFAGEAEDGTLLPLKNAYAKLNPDTQKVEVITEEIPLKYVMVKVTLHNPTDVDIERYFYQTAIISLEKDEEGYREGELPISFNEPIYLSFTDYSGKSSYQMDLAAGETREITALYFADEKSLADDYLRFEGIGYSDGTETSWSNYIKVVE